MAKDERLLVLLGTIGGERRVDGDGDDGNKRDSDGDDEEAPV